jgi:hypothetical protein
MLYRVNEMMDSLAPLPFEDASTLGKKEKDLENLLAANLFDVLFEESRLLPFCQEGHGQAVADIYALDEAGDVTLVELKRGTADDGALAQALRYAQETGRWKYEDLDVRYRAYAARQVNADTLAEAHQEHFGLDAPMLPHEFNRRQHMLIIGNAAHEALREGVAYWRRQGLAVDFLPYRLYQLGNEWLFEFFAKPDDVHINPRDKKGVLFDTNRSWDADSFRQMLTQNRVSAYGDRQDAVHCLQRGDYVFYSHRWCGVVGAAEVVGDKVESDGPDEQYWQVKLLTPPPADWDHPPAISFAEVRRLTGQNYYWARIDKRPYLQLSECSVLLKALGAV